MINSIAAASIWLLSTTSGNVASDPWLLVQVAVTCSSYLESAQRLGMGDRTVLRNSQVLMDNYLRTLPREIQQVAASARQQLTNQISTGLVMRTALTLEQIREVSQLCLHSSSQHTGLTDR